jgi:hypothetical protein
VPHPRSTSWRRSGVARATAARSRQSAGNESGRRRAQMPPACRRLRAPRPRTADRAAPHMWPRALAAIAKLQER